MRYYAFDERLRWSEGFLDGGVETILRDRIPGCHEIQKANENSDKAGTDYWALRRNLPPLSIDVKVRSTDWAQRGKDDLALETWSVIDAKVGWTRDHDKRTDYVLWYWADTGRFVLVSFPALCRVFCKYWREWSDKYKTARQNSGGWESECVFVPRDVVMGRLKAWSCGKVGRSAA